MNNRFTDINVPYEVDPNNTRTDEEVLADMEKNTQVTLLIESFDGPLMKNEIGCMAFLGL